MRILLDEQLPRQLRHHFLGHYVRTVRQQRWTGLRNGELLLRAAKSSFEVFVTADQNLEFQQNLIGLPIAVMVLLARSNKLEDLLPLLPSLLQAIGHARPGEVRRVGLP